MAQCPPSFPANAPHGDVSYGHRLFDEAMWRAIANHLHLSTRELEIVQGIFGGRTECEISHTLGIARRTVHTHLERLFRKLRVNDRVALAVAIFDAYLTVNGRKHK